MKSYIPIDVWQHHSDDVLVCYRCFRITPGDRFCVQSAEIFYAPIARKAIDDSNLQFIELLSEERPDIRSPSFDSVQAAIEHHIAEFGPIQASSKESSSPS